MRFHLDDLALFLRISELGTLSAAARERDVPVSYVTRALARLETACGVRLAHRTTHGLSLTDEGDTLVAYGRRLLDATDELDGELSGKLAGPSGWVRVGVSAVMAQAVVAPSIPGLYALYPAIQVDLAVDDRIADLARDSIDVAIRTERVQSDLLVARQIGMATRSLYAAPAYLSARGMPNSPEELKNHHLISSSRASVLNRWQRADRDEVIEARGHTRADNSATLLALTLAGAGISRILDVAARPFVEAGLLEPVLGAQLDQTPFPVFAVMLPERQRLPKIKACVDYWADRLSGRTNTTCSSRARRA